MCGMLTKEFLTVGSGRRILTYDLVAIVMTLAAAAAMADTSSSPSELAAYVGMLTGMLAACVTWNGAVADDKSKWDTYARSLPVDAAQIVGARYLFMLLLSAAGTALGVVVDLIASGGRADGSSLLLLCAVAFGVSILSCALVLPLLYRFGYQKNLILLVCVWPAVLMPISHRLTEAQLLFLLKLSPVILLAVLAVSFLLSCRIYRRREM